MKYVIIALGLLLSACTARAEPLRVIKTVPNGGTLTFTADGQSQSMAIQPGTYEIIITTLSGARPRIGHRKSR
jgi:hypothetical protein